MWNFLFFLPPPPLVNAGILDIGKPNCFVWIPKEAHGIVDFPQPRFIPQPCADVSGRGGQGVGMRRVAGLSGGVDHAPKSERTRQVRADSRDALEG